MAQEAKGDEAWARFLIGRTCWASDPKDLDESDKQLDMARRLARHARPARWLLSVTRRFAVSMPSAVIRAGHRNSRPPRLRSTESWTCNRSRSVRRVNASSTAFRFRTRPGMNW